MFVCIEGRHSVTLALSSNRKNEGLIQIRARVWVSIQRKKWELSIPPPPLLAAACRPCFASSPNFLSTLQQQSLVTRYVVLAVVIWEDLSNRKNPKPSKKEAKNLLVKALPSFVFVASSSRIINRGCCCFFFLRFFCSVPWSPCVLRDHCWVAGRRRRGRLQPHETLRLATESPRPICTKPALRNVLYIDLHLFCFFPSVQRSAKRREEKREIWEEEGRSRRRGRVRRNGCCWRWQQKSCHGADYQAPVHVSRDRWRASPRSQAFDPGLLSHAACWRSMSSCRCKRSRYCSPPVSQNLHLKFSRSFFLASSVVLGFRVFELLNALVLVSLLEFVFRLACLPIENVFLTTKHIYWLHYSLSNVFSCLMNQARQHCWRYWEESIWWIQLWLECWVDQPSMTPLWPQLVHFLTLVERCIFSLPCSFFPSPSCCLQTLWFELNSFVSGKLHCHGL